MLSEGHEKEKAKERRAEEERERSAQQAATADGESGKKVFGN